MKYFSLAAVLVGLLALVGCAGKARTAAQDEQEKRLQTMDRRLTALEQSVGALNSQTARLNNRVYEVRTAGGRKTGYRVVPILPPQSAQSLSAAATPPAPQSAQTVTPQASPAVTAAPAAPSAAAPVVRSAGGAASASASAGKTPPASGPQGLRIDPAAPPRPFPAQKADATAPQPPAGASAAASRAPVRPAAPATDALPANSGTTPGVLGLPPESLPSQPLPQASVAGNPVQGGATAVGAGAVSRAAAGAGGNPAVPVPALPRTELSLPPEPAGLGLPPLEGAAETASTAGSPRLAAHDQRAGRAPATSAVPPSPAAPSPAAAAGQAAPQGEDAAYKAALRLAMSGKSAESIARFQAFLQSYPQGRYAPNAVYWIGEGLYAQGRYAEALEQFRKVEAGWPRHHKNADALLKTGMSLSRMGDRQGAAKVYGEVLRRFPHSEAAGLVRARGLAR